MIETATFRTEGLGTPRRTKEILSAASGGSVDHSSEMYHTVDAMDRDITAMEEAFSSTCSSLFSVEGALDLSMDDDVTRQRSKRLGRETGLRQVHIPGKAVGANNTTVADPLTKITIAMRYAVTGEPTATTIEILLRRVQDQAAATMTNFRRLVTIYLDRGYLDPAVVRRINQANLLFFGAEKRGGSAPFTFGGSRAAPAAEKVEEVGILAAFWAEKKGR